MSESVYDAEIAPLLLQAAQICERHGLPFVAEVEYDPGKFGTTVVMGGPASFAMKLVHAATMAEGNIDALVIAAMKAAKQLPGDRAGESIVFRILEQDREWGSVDQGKGAR